MGEEQPERTCEGQAGTIDDADAAIDAAVDEAVAGERDPWATFDRWSANLFAALAILAGIVFLLVAGAASGADLPTLLLAILTIVLAIAPLIVAYTGLRERASWARAAADVLLWAIILSGAIQVLTDFTVQKLTIPIGAILAVVVLGRRPAKQPAVVGRDRRIALMVGGAYLVTGLLGGLATLGPRPPAFLIADRENLVLGASTNCLDPARITPDDADRVVVQATWRWTRDDLLPGGQDAVQLEWHGAMPLAPVLADIEAPAGLDPDATGPAMSLLAASTDPSTAVLAFGVASGRPGAREGTLRVPFEWTPGEEREFADFVVTWAHDDHWTALAMTSCEWPVDAEASPGPDASATAP